jgi:flavin-binding protein dodecin
MSIAKSTEITSASPESFDHAVAEGFKRASKTIDNIQRIWIKDMYADVHGDKIQEYRVAMKVTFLLKD